MAMFMRATRCHFTFMIYGRNRKVVVPGMIPNRNTLSHTISIFLEPYAGDILTMTNDGCNVVPRRARVCMMSHSRQPQLYNSWGSDTRRMADFVQPRQSINSGTPIRSPLKPAGPLNRKSRSLRTALSTSYLFTCVSSCLGSILGP